MQLVPLQMVPKCCWPKLPLRTDATEVSNKFHL